MTQQPTTDERAQVEEVEEPVSPAPALRSAVPWTARFRHPFGEILIAILVSFATAAVMGAKILQAPRTLIPGDGADPFIELWSLAWSGHALKPGSGVPLTHLFDSNIFYPSQYSLAFTDSLLGYGPITWFAHSAGGLILAYNLLMIFTPALSSLGGYALARQVGAHPIGAAVAAAALSYAPWRHSQYSHLHVLTTGPLLIALAMLARGHGFTMSGRGAPIRPIWVLLGWLFAAWQLTIGFAGGLPFCYLLAVIGVLVVVIVPVRRILDRRAGITRDRPPRFGWLMVTDLLGGALFAAVGAFMAYPYFQVQKIDPNAVLSARSLVAVARYSPTLRDLLTPPSRVGTWSWLTHGRILVRGNDEGKVLPGMILLALAFLGLVFSSWRLKWRLVLAAAAVVMVSLTLGTNFPNALFPGADSPYAQLWRHAPGWAADRTPGRLMAFCVIPLALLAAGAVTKLCRWAVQGTSGRRAGLRMAALAVLPVLVVVEGWASIPDLKAPAPPAAFTAAAGPMIVLPATWSHDSTVMFWSANRGFPLIGNGTSGIVPTSWGNMRGDLRHFPDARSVGYLRAHGFRSVVVLRGDFDGVTADEHDRVPAPSLGVTRTDMGDSVLFTIGAKSSAAAGK